jgi:short subunit dehydrogenase-like uncharacterized protein
MRAQIKKHAQEKLAEQKKLTAKEEEWKSAGEVKRKREAEAVFKRAEEAQKKRTEWSVVKEESDEEIDYALSQQVELCFDLYD